MDHAVIDRRTDAALTNILGTLEPIERGKVYARKGRFS